MEIFYWIIAILCITAYFLLNKSNLDPEVVHVPKITDTNEYYNDIRLEPYGCFTNVKDKFFTKKINPYSKLKVMDSGLFLSEEKDFSDLVKTVIKNGYDIYGNDIMNKYHGKTYNDITIQEMGVLGKLAGYNYLSIYKNNPQDRGKVYLTYSPPMEIALPDKYTQDEYSKNLSKTDLPGYEVTPSKDGYTNERELASGKVLGCGYPCSNNTFTKDNKEYQYMCGSAGYPNIKTPPRYSVYHIKES